MQHQLPTSFELTETYLTSLWDSLHNTVFDTFTLDSERVRRWRGHDDNSTDGQGTPALIARSVWDWPLQFHDVDIGLFYNPLFSISNRVASFRQQKGLPTTTVTLAARSSTWLATDTGDSAGPFLDRSRRNSIASLTLSRQMSQYGGHHHHEALVGSTDTLGRSWGSRLGLAMSSGGGNNSTADQQHRSSRWKKIRGALFHSHGSSRSFSPRTKIASIEENFDANQRSDDTPMVTYRTSRSSGVGSACTLSDPNPQRWTVCAEDYHFYSPPAIDRVSLSTSAGRAAEQQDLLWGDCDDFPIPYHQVNWPVYQVLPVADSLVNFRLWRQCYLRWIPLLDVRGGGQPPVYFQLCSLVNDILSLEYQLEQLHSCREAVVGRAALPQQRFVTMSDHNSCGIH